jgi:general secretion pathway protein G
MDKKMNKSIMNKILKQRAKKVSGFTLIELLIVMVIIGLLAAFIAPKLIGRVGESKQTAAKAQIELLSTAIDVYRLDTGKYPTQDSGLSALTAKPDSVNNWKGPYLKKEKVPKDPWSVDYVYRHPGEHGDYDIISYGADESEGGTGENKDLVSWE